MISIVTSDTMRALEQTVMDEGVSEADLIERAAAGIAGYIDGNVRSNAVADRSVLALAGPGNNGVDALLAAALLVERGWQAFAILVGRKDLDEIPADPESMSKIQVVDEIPPVDVILDGIYGISGRTDLPDPVNSTLNMVGKAKRRAPVPLLVAVDCPTGTNTETGEVAESILRADVTLCISNPKIGMLRAPALDYLGELVILDIEVRTDEPDPGVGAMMVDRDYVRTSLVPRPATAHKSQVGGLLIVGGAPGYYGAPRLAGEAALRAGCGYVGMAVPRSIAGSIATAVPELIFHPLSDADGRRSATTVREALSESKRYDALVVGPGLGRDEVASTLLENLFELHHPDRHDDARESIFGIPRRVEAVVDADDSNISAFPLVIDADALNWLSQQENWPSLLEGRTCVLTPHVGEMARLLKLESEEVAADAWNVARQAASDLGQVIVLKSAMTCVATPEGELFVAPRPTPELATPGTGDVLSGLIGAFLAQGNAPTAAAAIAIYAGAIAGRIARLRLGSRSVIARDVTACLPDVLRELESPALSMLSEAW